MLSAVLLANGLTALFGYGIWRAHKGWADFVTVSALGFPTFIALGALYVYG